MRILLKISWESLKWQREFWIEPEMVEKMALIIKDIVDSWVELAIVVWGGNIYRWWDLIKSWVDASDSHNLSMLSTVFNWVVLKNFLHKIWVDSIVMDCNWVNFTYAYSKDEAKRYLQEKKVVIFTGWTWNPYFTTDSWWVLRSLEIEADFMIKATRVDWVYDSDPEKNTNAKFYEEITYDEVLQKNLKVMDLTAIVLAKENNLKLKVVNLNKSWAILKAIDWKKEGTLIKA